MNKPMYAIAFDMDTAKCLKDKHGENNAHLKIGKVLEKHGFEHKQGSLYCGNETVTDPFTCTDAVTELVSKYKWFGDCVTDIRVFKIEQGSDIKDFVKKIHKIAYPK